MTKKLFVIIALAIFLPAALAACAKKPSGDDRVLAMVSNRAITLKEFKSKIAKMPAYYQNIIAKNQKRYLDETILEMLLYEEAVRRGIDKDREVREVVNEAKKKIVTAKFIKGEVEDKIKVSDPEMKRFYEANKNDFKTQAMWRASHILVTNEREATDILNELKAGADFAQMAKTHSIDATASRGGDVGFFKEAQLIPDFEKECLKLNPGETSGVVHTQFGYHIIKMTDKKEPTAKSYEEAKRDIEAELKRRKRSELFNNLVLNLKNKYNVKIKEDVFETLESAKK